MREYVGAVLAMARKDALLEMRTRETLPASIVFAGLIVAVFAFALDLAPATTRAIAPGLLWASLAFAGVMTFGRSFAAERDHGSLDGLLLAPIDRSTIYVGKLINSSVCLFVVLLIAVPLFALLLDVPLFSLALVPVALLGLVGLSAAGTLFAALALNTRARDVFLPILFLPVAVPVIMTAAGATRLALDGSASGDALGVLAACDALYIAASILLFDYALEE